MKINCALLGFAFLFSTVPSMPAQNSLPNAKLSLHDRVWIATQIYSSIRTYFGQWRGVPDLDLDREFQPYLDQIMASDDRYAFDLATTELTAKLKNGHTGFRDRWLIESRGQDLGFYAYPVDGAWVVTQSSIAGVKRGDVLSRIDNESFDDFFQDARKYISTSAERSAARFFFEYTFLFPRSFTLQLDGGREVRVIRKALPAQEQFAVTVQEREQTLYIRIPSFSNSALEEAAVRAVEQHASAKAIVIDVRGNHGGSSPETLIARLMNRPYRWWIQSTPVNFGLLNFQGMFGEHSDVVSYGGPSRSEKDAYQGALFILADGGCFSACEDFLIPFKDNHRAVILGSPTGGSTGQPVKLELGNSMVLSLSGRRVSFPDGSEFEGVGVVPDVEVHPNREDIRAGRDPALQKAYSLAAGSDGPR